MNLRAEKQAAHVRPQQKPVFAELKSRALTHEMKPSTHMFFQMFLLWRSSWRDKWGLEVGADSDSSSAAGGQGQDSLSVQLSNSLTVLCRPLHH